MGHADEAEPSSVVPRRRSLQGGNKKLARREGAEPLADIGAVEVAPAGMPRVRLRQLPGLRQPRFDGQVQECRPPVREKRQHIGGGAGIVLGFLQRRPRDDDIEAIGARAMALLL